MTDKRHRAEKPRQDDRAQGNLGQKEAEREEAADEKLDHLGDDDASNEASKKRNHRQK